MNKYEIIKKIETFAPPELAEKWDCSGWVVETLEKEIKKVMLCLTVTEDVIKQAHGCDMIISHHPLFFVPFGFKNINIYCAHTNMDRTKGGTTDTLVHALFTSNDYESIEQDDGFVRYVNCKQQVDDFIQRLKVISPHMRYVNNKGIKNLSKIAFCAGSGSEFINDAFEKGADAFVTGDLKFHTALDSPIALFDIGHFESEIMILDVFEKLLNNEVEIVRAKECSPFIYP